MRNKIIIWVLMLMSAVVFLPAENYAAANEKTNSVTVNEFAPQIRVQVGRRNRNRHWNRGRHRGWENRRNNNARRNNRTRLVQQVYYANGRRYVRWVRVRY